MAYSEQQQGDGHVKSSYAVCDTQSLQGTSIPFLSQQSCLKSVWKVCLVHWFCYTTNQWNILTYKLILCHVCVSLLCLQCNAAGYIGCIQQCQVASLDIIISMTVIVTDISEHFPPFINPSLCNKWQENKPLWICVFVCVCVKDCCGGSFQNIKKFC